MNNTQIAASTAQVITNRMLETPSLLADFKSAVSPEQKKQFNDLTQQIGMGVLQVAIADSKSDKATAVNTLYGLMIKRAEITSDVLIKFDNKYEDSLAHIFNLVKTKYNTVDFAKVYKDTSAPTLARLASKGPKAS